MQVKNKCDYQNQTAGRQIKSLPLAKLSYIVLPTPCFNQCFHILGFKNGLELLLAGILFLYRAKLIFVVGWLVRSANL